MPLLCCKSISHFDTSFIREHIDPGKAEVILRLDEMNKNLRGPSDEMHVPKVSSLAVAVATHKKFTQGACRKKRAGGKRARWYVKN